MPKKRRIKDLLTNKEVSELLDIPKRRVLHWSEIGIVEAAIEPETPGGKRMYSYENLIEFKLATVLIYQCGLGRYKTKELLKQKRFINLALKRDGYIWFHIIPSENIDVVFGIDIKTIEKEVESPRPLPSCLVV